ncbi:MAG: TonB-dependent receptor plug domain-containing protein [Bryobacteraceae bacterium]
MLKSIVHRVLLTFLVFPFLATCQTSAPSHTGTKQQVVVTGTWVPVPLDESDRSVQSYSVARTGLLFTSPADVFSLDSSVQVQGRAPNGVQGDLSIRGGSFAQTLVLLNGIRLSDAQSAHHNLDIPVPFDAISKVEVLHGSGSTLYGSDAVAGVVNVVTRPVDAESPIEMRLRAAYGSFGTDEESGFLALKYRALSQRFSFERERSLGFQDNRDYRNLALASESWVQTKLGLSRVFLSLLDRPFGADQFYGNYSSWERTKTWLASLRQDLGSNTSVSFAYRRHTDLYVLLRTNPAYYTNRHEDETWDLTLRRQDTITKNAQVFYGGEGIADEVNSTNLGFHKRNRGALYGDLDVRSVGRFSFNVGLRQEFYASGQTTALPSLSGGYWLSSKVKFRASLNRAFRLPNYTDLYYHDPANIGNPNLQPERAWNAEGGVDLHLADHWRGSFTFFSRHETDNIDYIRANPAAIWQATNFGRLTFNGWEASLNWSRNGQSVDVQYTGIHGIQSALGGYQSKYLFNYPSQQGIVGWQRVSRYGLQTRVRVGITNQEQRPAYMLVDAYAAYTRSPVHPYLRLTNLTDASYQPVLGVVMPGRAFLAGVEWCVICRPRR